jgi:predicted MFS family arabinose efflux permease
VTLTAPAAAPARDGGRPRTRHVIAGFAVTQTVGYGVLFYAFSVLLTPIAADLRTGTAAVTGALTLSILVAAAATIPVGRWLDRHGGRALMTAGSVLGVAAVVAWSQVHSLWQLYAAFVLIGLAGAMTLYEVAFAVVVATVQPGRRDAALLAVTIVAGFASSIFFPLTGLLLNEFGWRTALLILAGLLAAVTVPLHVALVPAGRHPPAVAANTGAGVRDALTDGRFWLLTAAFVAHAAAVSAVGVLLVSYLRHAGHTTGIAATLAGLLGVLSVTGRLATTGLARRHGMATVAAAVFLVQAAGAAVLPWLGRSVAGAAACVVAFGLGFGVATIARPAIVADRYGTRRFATIAGAMTLPVTLAKAGAPAAAAALPPDTFTTAAAAACAAGGLLLWIARQPGSPPGPGHIGVGGSASPRGCGGCAGGAGASGGDGPGGQVECGHQHGEGGKTGQVLAGLVHHFPDVEDGRAEAEQRPDREHPPARTPPHRGGRQ